MKKQQSKRGGKREGAGRPAEGKKNYTVSLTEKHVDRARKREGNFSGLLDRLLSEWLATKPLKRSSPE